MRPGPKHKCPVNEQHLPEEASQHIYCIYIYNALFCRCALIRFRAAPTQQIVLCWSGSGICMCSPPWYVKSKTCREPIPPLRITGPVRHAKRRIADIMMVRLRVIQSSHRDMFPYHVSNARGFSPCLYMQN